MKTNRQPAPHSQTANTGHSIVRETYSQGSVAAKIGDDLDESSFILGVLRIVEKPIGIYIEWSATDDEDWVDVASTANGRDDKLASITSSSSVHSTPKAEASSPSGTVPILAGKERAELIKRISFSVDIKDLRSFQSHENHRRLSNWPWVKLMGKCGTTYVPLYFRDGGLSKFIEALQMYTALKRSKKDPDLILFVDESTEALQQSVNLLFSQEKHERADFMSRLLSNPYNTAMTSLGKVAHMLHDLPQIALDDFSTLDTADQQLAIQSIQKMNLHHSEDSEKFGCFEDAGFEMITRIDLPQRPTVTREQPLSASQWNSYRDGEGRIKNARQLKLLIFRGGVEPALRKEVWKYLLDYYKWDATNEERTNERRQKADRYFRMKLQWKTISDEQEANWMEFRDRKALIDKDVKRTDRTHIYYEGQSNANLDMLSDILNTYMMYHFDLGYVQGMSDCLSPILVVMQDEVDAFWAFVGFMKRIHKNFEMDQSSIRYQLMRLCDLLMIVNPRLANYLESHQSDNMFFCFRWVLVQFKREFSYNNITRLWEVLWTDLPCDNFHLLVCVAILDMQANVIIENKYGLTEILKHVNDLSMQLVLDEILTTAEAIYHQLAATQDKLPAHICEILGFSINSSNPVVSSQRSGASGIPRRPSASNNLQGSSKTASGANSNTVSNTSSGNNDCKKTQK